MGDITHSAKRVYRNSELELWLRRIMQDWEKPFRIEELEYGRILYKTSAIRTIELNRDEAIICARMDDGAEPYCVIDFDGDKFVYRGSDDCSLLTASLSVAGMYEIEELLGDILGADGVFELPDSVAKSSGDIDKLQAVTSPCDNVTAEHANDNTALDAGKSRVARNALVGVSNSGGSENLAPRELALTFTSRRKGLTFSAEWVLANGKTRKAFGDSCLPVESLTARECENLIRLASLARKSGFKYESELYTLLDISKIQTFLTLMLPKWREHFTIHKDRNVELLKAGERRVELMPKAKSVRGDSADFDVQWTPSVGGIEIDPTELSKLVGGVGSLRIIPQYGIVRVSNADTSFVREVERGREFGFKDGKIPRYMLLTLSDFGERINLSADLKKWMKSLTGQKCDAVLDLPPFLRKYQTRGVEWAIKLFNHDCNAMIADEMGLGKTLQTLSIIDFYLRKSGFDKNKKFLVVCPASVIPVWISESQKFFPLIKTDVLKSDGIDDSAQLIISSYTQLRRNKPVVDKIKFELAILDEAQFIKNPDAKTTSACMGICAVRKIALTGTPVENRLLDMWTTFRWLMPGLMGTRKNFEDMVATDSDAIAAIRRQIAPFVLRRLKTEVAAELPEKIYVDLMCPMTDFQNSEYQKLLTRAREELRQSAEATSQQGRFTILSLLTRLRQAACDAALLPWVGADGAAEIGGKISVLLDKVEELYFGGKKVLIFSQFTKFLDLIESKMKNKVPESDIYKLTGSTRDRALPVNSFQNARGGAVMFVSLRAGGTGITLTSADYVFLADPWWNPAVEEQAIDRVHRIGRNGDVFIYRMIAQDTVEDRVRKLQSQKKKLFNELLGGLKDVSNQSKFIETISDILE